MYSDDEDQASRELAKRLHAQLNDPNHYLEQDYEEALRLSAEDRDHAANSHEENERLFVQFLEQEGQDPKVPAVLLLYDGSRICRGR